MLEFINKSEAFEFIDEYPSDNLKGILEYEYGVKIPFIYQSDPKKVWKYLVSCKFETGFKDYQDAMNNILDTFDDIINTESVVEEIEKGSNTKKSKKAVRIGVPVSGEPKVLFNKYTGNWESYVGDSMIGNSSQKSWVISKFPYFGVPLESIQHLL